MHDNPDTIDSSFLPASRRRAPMRPWLVRVSTAAVLALLLVPSSVFAKQVRLFSGSFGAASSTPVDPYPLSKPESVAVDDASHDVYVTDPGNHRVEKFDSSGNFLLAFGANVGGPGVNVCGGVVVCSPGTAGSAPGEFEVEEAPRGASSTESMYVAVDNSSKGPSAGDVYVAENSSGRNQTELFKVQGKLVNDVTERPTGGTFTLTFEGQTTAPIAFDATAAEINKKLEALSTIGAGNVAVVEVEKPEGESALNSLVRLRTQVCPTWKPTGPLSSRAGVEFSLIMV
jgi:hypothetical protein